MIKPSLLLLCTVAMVAALQVSPATEPASGYEWLSDPVREMQDDEFANPGYLVVDAGAELFAIAGKTGKSCSDCHGDGGAQLEVGRIAMYPVFDHQSQKPMTLQGRIHACSQTHLGNPAMRYDSKDAVALETFVRNLAHGVPVNVRIDGDLAPFAEQGKAFFEGRRGQMDMSCAHCHVNYAGLKLRAQTLSQGQLNGFPTYRLTNQRVNGTHLRFRQCENSLRASYQPAGAEDYVNLELYMMSRGNGLPIETPAIRF